MAGLTSPVYNLLGPPRPAEDQQQLWYRESCELALIAVQGVQQDLPRNLSMDQLRLWLVLHILVRIGSHTLFAPSGSGALFGKPVLKKRFKIFIDVITG